MLLDVKFAFDERLGHDNLRGDIVAFGKPSGQVSGWTLAHLKIRMGIDMEGPVPMLNRAETKIASARELLAATTGARWGGVGSSGGDREGETAMLSAQSDFPRAEQRPQNGGRGAGAAHRKALIES